MAVEPQNARIPESWPISQKRASQESCLTRNIPMGLFMSKKYAFAGWSHREMRLFLSTLSWFCQIQSLKHFSHWSNVPLSGMYFPWLPRTLLKCTLNMTHYSPKSWSIKVTSWHHTSAYLESHLNNWKWGSCFQWCPRCYRIDFKAVSGPFGAWSTNSIPSSSIRKHKSSQRAPWDVTIKSGKKIPDDSFRNIVRSCKWISLTRLLIASFLDPCAFTILIVSICCPHMLSCNMDTS